MKTVTKEKQNFSKYNETEEDLYSIEWDYEVITCAIQIKSSDLFVAKYEVSNKRHASINYGPM